MTASNLTQVDKNLLTPRDSAQQNQLLSEMTERFRGGESMRELAKDYGVGEEAIEEALRVA